MGVIKGKRVFRTHVYNIGKSVFQLDDSNNPIIDESNKLRTYAFAYQRFLFDAQRTDTFGLNIKLVGQ